MSAIDLQNTQTWTTKDGHTQRIDELDEGHARNILRFLERHAPAMEFVDSWNCVMSLPDHMGDMAEMAVMEDIERTGKDPIGWVRCQPAYLAIRKHLEELDRRPSPDLAKPIPAPRTLADYQRAQEG